MNRKSPDPAAAFDGFPAEGLRFLKQLKRNNDRDWFRERKHDYKTLVEQPMAALVHAVSEGSVASGVPLYPKDKNPVMRVYRDIRFSKDKRPLKTHVSAELRRSFTGSQACLYVHLSPEDSFLASGVWMPERPLLQQWRRAMSDDPKRFEKIVGGLAKQKLKLSEECALSKMPRGFDSFTDSSIAPFLRLTSFVVSTKVTPEQYQSPAFVDIAVKFARAAKPLLEFAWSVEQSVSKQEPARIPAHELF